MAALSQDPFEALIRKYLTVNGQVHNDAYEVVLRWYNYLNALANSTANQMGTPTPAIGTDAVEVAFETPIIGFIGNPFWAEHGASILPLVTQDIVRHNTMLRFPENPQMAVALNVGARLGFIGQVVALVQRDGTHSWKAFEFELRTLLDKLTKEHFSGHTDHDRQ